jgi:hypothetical protein
MKNNWYANLRHDFLNCGAPEEGRDLFLVTSPRYQEFFELQMYPDIGPQVSKILYKLFW